MTSLRDALELLAIAVATLDPTSELKVTMSKKALEEFGKEFGSRARIPEEASVLLPRLSRTYRLRCYPT